MPPLDTLAKWARHYATLLGVAAWRFTVALAPGLTHEGAPAWAVVVPDADTKTAAVRVRDLDATPIPGFDGDPLFEIKVTLAHEMAHLLAAEWLADPTVANEERVVECVAQAVVRSEMSGDARVMARAIKALPGAIRARVAKVSASAGQRARGGTMDPKMVDEALQALIDEGQGDSKCAGILRQIVASMAAKGAGGTGDVPPAGGDVPPPSDARPGEDMANKEKPDQQPGNAPPPARPVGRDAPADDADARRARSADRALASLHQSAIRARIHEVETVNGVAMTEAQRTMILAEKDIDGAEKLLKFGGLTTGPTRARSGEKPPGATPPNNGAAPKYDEAALVKEGIHPQMAHDIATETDPAAAELALKAARARIASSTPTWPTGPKNGVAS
jgi:hypothetical protein